MHVFIFIAFSNDVGKLAFMALNMWMIVLASVCKEEFVAKFKEISVH